MKTLQAQDIVWIKASKNFGTVTEIKEDKIQVRYTHDIWGKHDQRLESFSTDELTKFNMNQFDQKPKARKIKAQYKESHSSRDLSNVLDLLGE